MNGWTKKYERIANVKKYQLSDKLKVNYSNFGLDCPQIVKNSIQNTPLVNQQLKKCWTYRGDLAWLDDEAAVEFEACFLVTSCVV